MTEILLIRHALTDFAGKRLTGRSPGTQLNKEGIMQASLLAVKLAENPLVAIYSSPLERAVETAKPLAEALGLTLITSEYFTEIDFGEWTNLTIEELRQNQSFMNFNSFRSFARIPGGELMAEAQMRILKGIEAICHDHKEKSVAIVSHAEMIRSAIAHYAGIHPDMMGRIEISPASVSVIRIFEGTARILKVNQTF